MKKQSEKKFVCVLKNPTSFRFNQCSSDPFVIAGCKWHLYVFSKGNNLEFFYQYLGVADCQSLPCKWRKHVKLRLNIVNRISEKLSIVTDSELYFDEMSPIRSYPTVVPPSKLLAKDGGFLVNDEVKIVVEVVAHEVFGSLGGFEDSKLLSRIEESRHGAKSNHLFKKTKLMNESCNVNGFQVHPSQVETVKRILRKFPDFGSNIRSKNRFLKSNYMNIVLGVVETLCQLPMEITDDDLNEASIAMSFVAEEGFKLDWLETMLKEVKAKKKNIDSGKARLQQLEQELQIYNKKCLGVKALMEDVKAMVSAANAPLSFEDVV